jgi:hypothetical protein
MQVTLLLPRPISNFLHAIRLLSKRDTLQQSAAVLSNCTSNSSVQHNLAFLMASDA